MSVKGVVSSVKNRERVSGSTFWRHSWHCSAYLPREVALARLADSQLPAHQARSLENMIRAKIDNNNATSSKAGSWQRGQDSQRSSPKPSGAHSTQDVATPHTAPVSPLHDQYASHGRKDRRRIPGISKTQRRIKASSTPALLDRDHESRQWSGDEESDGTRSHQTRTEHPLTEATIPLVTHSRLQDPSTLNSSNVITTSGGGSGQNSHRTSTPQSQQESVLQKFRKSFSLRFHKKGSKESTEGECPVEENERTTGQLGEEEERETSTILSSEQSSQHKDDPGNDQKFRFGPLVWRSSKERKKSNKAARNAKCNSGDSGIQIEMVSGGALTVGSSGGTMGGGDSSESHDTDVQDETDSPPALRRRVADKSRPQSELINQILIDKFKADLQSRASRHQHVRRANSDLGGQRLLQWDTRSGYSHIHNYRRMLSTPSPIKSRPPRLSPRHSSHDIVTLRSNAKGRSSRTNLRRSLSQPLGINQLSPLMRTKTAGARLPGGNVLSEDEQDGRGGTSDDEMMSDSESSIASLTDRKKSFEQTMDEEMVVLAEAVWDHVAMEPEELAFRAGDLIDVLDMVDKDWWWGSCEGERGWFPAAFVRLRVSQEDTVEDCLAAIASGGTSNSQRRRTSVSLLSNEQVRTSVVRELVQTERDFVKILRDVTEGYIAECRRRTDMFNEEQIETIFINIEELLDFQSEFLKDLESRIDWNSPYKSCVGECFLKHRAGFRMYSEYCNSHPMATATLQELYQHNRYSKFFEACRLMRGLIEIPLDGYLLTPVQRICKYPLQLAELLKYTKADHPDYHKIQEALEAMRGVAVLINERKRRMESLEKLAAWQLRVEGWEGEDLIEVSSQLIYQGDAMRVTTGMWTNNITLFLFDHQLVYCKKDILKRNTYVYKGRIYLDTSEVIDVPDGKDHQLGVTVRHCLKVYSCVRDKWLLFCCRTAEEKHRWLVAMAEERRLVAQDRNDGLEFPAAARQLARLAANRQRIRPPVKPRSKSYKREPTYDVSNVVAQGATNSLGRKVGIWFTFGSSKKNARPQPS
ncbi:spermatogenesis-associated protein 13 isoform X3 [Polistes fuscatus]|uniref:spermatogenesis-associated protein 13 isoform X3 n=1 Tax=Polistes fuscatus TaxID=30207 RepID=UPI001CA9403E|nr:spermatogenesis-associated protein 13 isoform X3 [Polistes fuscatus]XP_043497686.1 spermatogenesis-associated protein 13 isoform X3 [Polistes fuscatus]